MSIPNLLTLFRVAMIPVFIAFFYADDALMYFFSAVIFLAAVLTDALDGHLARKWNQTSAFGAFLDPVADKLLVVMCLCILIEYHYSAYFTVPAMVIIAREFIVSALREWMAEIGQRVSVAVSSLGKVKTGTQMTALVMFLLVPAAQGWFAWAYWPLIVVAYILFYVATVLTVWSMVDYLRQAWPVLNNGKT